jgi:hypothetical protein
MEYELPYDFDLHFDIKTKLQLVKEYVRVKSRFENMVDVCKSHNIDIDKLVKEYNEISE